MAKIDNHFSDLEKELLKPGSTRRREKAATDWWIETMKRTHRASYDQQSKKYSVRPQDWMKTRRGIVRPPIQGQMFCYWYDAKWKNELPYWDRFPIVLIIEMYDDGWLGLNLHYLPPFYRARLLGLIMGTMMSVKLSREAKARVTYDLIQSAAKWNVAKPCIKRYLRQHIVGKIVRVPPDEWEHTVMLPMDTWVGAARQQVWLESVQKMRGTGS